MEYRGFQGRRDRRSGAAAGGGVEALGDCTPARWGERYFKNRISIRAANPSVIRAGVCVSYDMCAFVFFPFFFHFFFFFSFPRMRVRAWVRERWKENEKEEVDFQITHPYICGCRGRKWGGWGRRRRGEGGGGGAKSFNGSHPSSSPPPSAPLVPARY